MIAHRIQVCGETEISYLPSVPPERRTEVLARFFGLELSCVIITCGFAPPDEFTAVAQDTSTPLVVVREKTGAAIQALEDFLDDRLAPRTQIHGVLIDVFGVGMLLIGESGVGKSECALDLVLRGHRLVADDVVLCDYRPPGVVFGAPAGILRHHIEVRVVWGCSILRIFFGVTAVRDRKRVDVIVHLRDGTDEAEYDRLGIEDRYYNLLGVQVRETRAAGASGPATWRRFWKSPRATSFPAVRATTRRASFSLRSSAGLKEGIEYNSDSVLPMSPCVPRKPI